MHLNKYKTLFSATIILLGLHAFTPTMAEGSNLVYAPVEPCRIFDTRNEGGIIASGTSRDFYVHGDAGEISGQGGDPAGCTAPQGEPIAVHLNITAVPFGNGHLRVYPKGTTLPDASTLNYINGVNIANAVTVKSTFDVADLDISIYSANNTHVLADVQGYYYPKIKNAITVSAQYADFTSPIDAINSIPSTGPDIPSSTNPYVIEIGPGTYNLGSTQLVMKEWVDIKGVGSREATVLTGAVSASSLDTSAALLVGANNAELSDLTIINTGGNVYSIAVYNNTTSPKIRRIKARASGGSTNFGVYNNNASPLLSTTGARGSGGSTNVGVYNSNSSPKMKAVTAEASGGTNNIAVYNTGASSAPTINRLIADSTGGSGTNTAVESINGALVTISESAMYGDDFGIWTGAGVVTVSSSTLKAGASGTTAGGTTANNRCFYVTNEISSLNTNCLP